MSNIRSFKGARAPAGSEPEHTHRRSWPWLAAAVVFCPCHLPLTLSLLAGGLLGGTLTSNTGWIYLGFAAAFVLMLWRGFSRLGEKDDCRACQLKS